MACTVAGSVAGTVAGTVACTVAGTVAGTGAGTVGLHYCRPCCMLSHRHCSGTGTLQLIVFQLIVNLIIV